MSALPPITTAKAGVVSKKRIDSAIDEAQAALRPLFYTVNGPDREQQ